MANLALMLLLIFTGWLASQITLFIPINLFHGLQFGFEYLFLGLLIIAISWLIGE